jgi:hypothetical protein
MSERKERILYGSLAVLLVVACMALACALAGCAARVKNVTNLPTGVTLAEVQAWDSEVAALHKIATVTSSVRQGVIGLEQAGAFPDSVAYVKALQSIAKIDQLELEASAFLRATPQHFGALEKVKIAAMVKQIGDEIQGLNMQSLAQIKNADTKKNVTILVNDLVVAMNLALSLTQ